MSCCIEPKIVIERLRNGDKFSDEELTSLCVVSLCDKLRAELRIEDIEMVRDMLQSENPYIACIGQVLVRPFLYKDNMKGFLIELWKNTKHKYLKAGLLFDLFEYKDLDKGFLKDAFRFVEDNKEIVFRMLSEWLEGEDRIIFVIRQKLNNKKRQTPYKKALYEQILRFASSVCSTV